MHIYIDVFFLERKSDIIYNISGELFDMEIICDIKFNFWRKYLLREISSVNSIFSENIFNISSSLFFINIGI